MEVYKKYIKQDKKGIELGCSNGYSTTCLADLLDKLVVIDGSRSMLEKAAKCNEKKNVRFEYKLFEELDYKDEYDYVFCSYVLEHARDPEEICQVCYKMLKQGGVLFITVPNGTALSRQMALEMGILTDLYALTENDVAHGHRRVYNIEKLRELVEITPFKLIQTGGTFIKPYADFQLNQMIENGIIGENQLKGMQKLAGKYPEISGSIYAVLAKE